MKSLDELKAIREKTIEKINLRGEYEGNIRVVVGMATCGMAAGAGPVLDAFTAEVEKLGLKNVSVVKSGCIGYCQVEPIAEVYTSGSGKVTYIKLTPEMVPEIVSEHLANNRVVEKYTATMAEKEGVA